MKSKGRRRVEAELLAMRDEAQQHLDKQRRASKQGVPPLRGKGGGEHRWREREADEHAHTRLAV